MSHGPQGSVPRVVVSCEHGGNRVPERYRTLFLGAEAVLASHRGWDPGTLPLARALARRLEAPLHVSTVSRLVVDRNRSPGHPRVFSRWTRALPEPERESLLRRLHEPWRAAVLARVEEEVAAGGPILHLSVHSFTPVLDGRPRRTELALLYDPARAGERTLAAGWLAALRARRPHVQVRRNHPYRGVSDGMTTWLRSRFPGESYLGIEVEVSQALLQGRCFPAWVEAELAGALLEAWPPGRTEAVA